jgi:hypothetical protein
LTANADRKIPGAGTGFFQFSESLFDQPVFKGMKGNDAQSTSGPKPPGRDRQQLLDGIKFLINLNADRLKNPSGRVLIFLTALGRHRPPDDFRQIGCRGKRGVIASVYNGTSYLLGVPLFTVLAENPGQFFFSVCIDHIRCGLTAVTVHSHIQRPFLPITKTPTGLIKLPRRNTKISQYSIRAVDSQLSHNLGKIGKITMYDLPRGRTFDRSQALAAGSHGILVAVDRDQTTTVAQAREQFGGMPAPAQCTINIKTIREDVHQIQNRLHENRLMREAKFP